MTKKSKMYIAKNQKICYNCSDKKLKGLEWDIVSILDYYKKKKKSSEFIQNIEIPTFSNDKFWFLRKIPRPMLKVGPFSQSVKKPLYVIDTKRVIGNTMYGKNYKIAQQTPMTFDNNGLENIWNGVKGKHEILKHVNPHEDNSKVLSAIDKGITFERLLGKEWDNDVSRSIVQQVQARTQKYNDVFFRLDDAKRGLIASKEKRLTPNEAIRYMQWERVVKDPCIINDMMTQKQAEEKGYLFNEKNMPISIFVNKANEPLYDVAGMYNESQLVPNYTMSKSIKDVLRGVNSSSMEVFTKELARSTGVQITKSQDASKEEIGIKTRTLRTLAKKAKNLVAKTLGRTEGALNKSLTVEVSTDLSTAEQTYLLTRDIVLESIMPYMRKIEKVCVLRMDAVDDDIWLNVLSRLKMDIKADNLPTYEELKKNEFIIQDVAGSIIASQVVKMGNLREKEASALSELYKVDAMQLLSQVTNKDNTWMMPMIASIVSLTLPKFAKDLNVNFKQYADKSNIKNAKNLAEAIFGIATLDVTRGVLTREQEESQINVNVFGEFNEDYKPQVFDFGNVEKMLEQNKMAKANKLLDSMGTWMQEFESKIDEIDMLEVRYNEVRKEKLTGSINKEDFNKYMQLLDEIDVKRVEAKYLLNDVQEFTKLVEKYDIVKNSSLWEEIQEIPTLSDGIFENWQLKTSMLKSELKYVNSISTENEVEYKKDYAEKFATYIKHEKTYLDNFGELMLWDEYDTRGVDEIAIFRSIYNRQVENKEITEDEAKEIIDFYKSFQMRELEEKSDVISTQNSISNTKLSQKKLSDWKWKLRAGLVTYKEYLNALRGVKPIKVVEEDNSGIAEKIKQAVINGKILEDIVEQAKSKKNVVEDDEKVLLTKKELEDLRKEAKLVDNAVIYTSKNLQPGYELTSKGQKFSVNKYNKEIKEIADKLTPGKLPEFLSGELLYRNKEYLLSTIIPMDGDKFTGQIVRKAKETVAKSLKTEYNIKVKEVAKSIIKSKKKDEEEMETLSNKQDICSNIKNHFELRTKSTKKVKEKGADLNPRFVAQLNAGESLKFTAEQIATKVLSFYSSNRELLKDYTASTVYKLYIESVGAKELDNAIRGTVINPMVDAINEESRQLM